MGGIINEHGKPDYKKWLPTTVKEAKIRGWGKMDVIFFSGDAYVDHPSFGTAVIGRLLENMGLKVAIVPQPNWQDDLRDFKKFGTPRLFFGVTSGCMDSMVNHYTANKRKRSDDAYTPGNKSGARPDYATSTYSKIIKKLYPDTPVIIGGVEASLRRFAHYDYWSDKLLPSILQDSNADLLVYGMGEKPITEIVKLIEKGVPVKDIQTINQTAFKLKKSDIPASKKNWNTQQLAPYEKCIKDKHLHASNFKIIEEESNKVQSDRLIQESGKDVIIVNPSNPPLSEKEMDSIYDLPFTRLPHPKYNKKATIPAYEMIRHSVNIHRGCFGGCSFCTISAHQGKHISSRSRASVIKEIDSVTKMPDFKGYLSDVGGPSANMWKMTGMDIEKCKNCKRPSCLYPKICNNLKTDHSELINLYKDINKIPGIKKAFIGSGIRYDYLMNNESSNFTSYFTEVVKSHVSGRLKVAPEHTSKSVLHVMRKPDMSLFEQLNTLFKKANNDNNLKQQLIPYFISSHPECKEEDMAELAVKTKEMNFRLEQVQDFTPTPMTLATVMYYTGINPYTGKKVFTAKSQKDKKNQRQFFFWYKPEERKNIKNRLTQINRPDLIQKLFKK